MKNLQVLSVIFLLAFSVSVNATLTPSSDFDSSPWYIVTTFLEEGWNIVPFIDMHGPSSIFPESEIKSENIKAMYYYSTFQKKYVKVFPYDNDDAIENIYLDAAAFGWDPYVEEPNSLIADYVKTSSVWIYSDKSAMLKYQIEGKHINDMLRNRKLLKGYNFIIGPYYNKATTEEEFTGTCRIQKIYAYDAENREWIKDFGIETIIKDGSGVGFLIKVQDDCQLGGRDISLPDAPPVLPPDSDFSFDREKEKSSKCKDSDGGNNYNIKGYIMVEEKGQFQKVEDKCGVSYDNNPNNNPNQLNEKSCRSDGQAIESLCPYGCKDGACLQKTQTECGNKICEKGENDACPSDCANKCSDSDGGINYNARGYVEGIYNSGTYYTKDFCEYSAEHEYNPNLLHEYSCSKDGNYLETEYLCPNGCKEAACVKENPVNGLMTVLLWTDKTNYENNEKIKFFAKIVETDGSPFTPDEDAQVYLGLTTPQGKNTLGTSMEYNPSTGYYEFSQLVEESMESGIWSAYISVTSKSNPQVATKSKQITFQVNENVVCSDSDGDNFYTYGYVSGSNVYKWDDQMLKSVVVTGKLYDYCDGNRLYEAKCIQNCEPFNKELNQENMCNYWNYYDCPKGCTEGTCITI